MCAVRLFVVGKNHNELTKFEVEENSYSPEGKINGLDTEEMKNSWTLKHLAATCTLNNRANLVNQNGKWDAQGEPTEASLKALAEKIGQYRVDAVTNKKDALNYEKEMKEMI